MNRIYDSFFIPFVLRFVWRGSVPSIVRKTVRCIVFFRNRTHDGSNDSCTVLFLDGNGRELPPKGCAEVLRFH